MIEITQAIGDKNPYLTTHGHVAAAWWEVCDHIVKSSGCCEGVDPDSIRGKMDRMILYSTVCIIDVTTSFADARSDFKELLELIRAQVGNL